MSYAMSGSYGTGYLGFVGLGDDKIEEDAEVTLRFRSAGLQTNDGPSVLDAIKAKVLATRHFKDPEYLGWGSNGTLVYRGEVRSDNYTLQEIANFMPGIARQISQATGKDVRFVHAADEDGNIKTATQPEPGPGGSGPGGGGSGPGGRGSGPGGRGSITETSTGNTGLIVGVAVAVGLIVVGLSFSKPRG